MSYVECCSSEKTEDKKELAVKFKIMIIFHLLLLFNCLNPVLLYDKS